MARGIKRNPNRKEVRTIAVNVRLNEYEYEQLQNCLNTFKETKTISTFIRDLINAKTREMQKDINSQFNG
jgi:hypothetical protein